MSVPLLATKFRIHPIRRNYVERTRLVDRMQAGIDRKLTLVSAPAGFGKSTLLAEWAGRLLNPPVGEKVSNRVAWLALEESDNDYVSFLSYLVGALRSADDGYDAIIGEGAAEVLGMKHAPGAQQILTPLLNQISARSDRTVLVLDDYQFIETEAIHLLLGFLLDHMPPNMHLAVCTRQDPPLPLARLRAQDEMTELRAADLRFSVEEVARFMTRTMALGISAEDAATLEARTEGWVAGLQLAGMSMQGRENVGDLVRSFAASHRHVADYLLQEVLSRQPEHLQLFLLRTSILTRLSGPLCDALTGEEGGQQVLETLERSNSFILPMDNERRWYRYHELFAGLLRQRLRLRAMSPGGLEGPDLSELHLRASVWYEQNGYEIEAFRHAAAANDVDRAGRLMAGDGLPLQFRGAAALVLSWLRSLPREVLDARPSLWVNFASASVFVGRRDGVEEKLRAAEAALENEGSDETARDSIGRIAAIRAMLAVPRSEVQTIITQSRRALEHLSSRNEAARTVATWTLGVAAELSGERAAAAQAYTEVVSRSTASGNLLFTVAATTSLAKMQEAQNQLSLAEESYRRALELGGDAPLPFACEAHLGLARVCYERNELETAEYHARKSLQLARGIDGVDTPAACWAFYARLKLSHDDADGAASVLAEAEEFVRRSGFPHRMGEVAAAQVVAMLHRGELAAAARRARDLELPLSLARVQLAREEPSAALAVLVPLRRRAQLNAWPHELLEVAVLQSLCYAVTGQMSEALDSLEDAMRQAEPEGFVRVFVDEGAPMTRLLLEAARRGVGGDFSRKLLSACTSAADRRPRQSEAQEAELVEPLSRREAEVLKLIGEGLSNEEVGRKLFVSLHTIKAHTRNIYAKLGAHNRTEAVAKARSFGFLPER